MKHWSKTLKSATLAALALGLLAAAPGCGSGGDGGVSDGGCSTTFSQVTIWPKCVNCHSSKVTGDARMLATVGVDFDQYESAKTYGASAVTYVMFTLMPPPPMAAATDAEKASLQSWVDCGMPK